MNKFHKAPNQIVQNKMVQHLNLGQERLNGKLISPYQPNGVRFMILKELTGPGCILADDMGLGKTVMTVAFILAMHEHNQLPTLVIAPKSVCQQWKDEVHKFSNLKAALYDKHIQLDSFDVIVISYSFFMRESCLESSIMKQKFHRTILDEAHIIKNPNTVSSRHIRQISTTKRLCLSGTPIQNDPKDLFSLVKWIFHDESSQLSSKLNMSSKSKSTRMRCTDFIRNNMLLRRTMDDVSQFNPDLTLPSLTVKVVSVPFASQQEALLYQHVEEIARDRISKVLKQYNTQGNMDILEALLRCRQVCIHPKIFVDAVNEQAGVAAKWKIPSGLLNQQPQHSTKLSALVNMIQAHMDDKTLIFSSFVKEMRIIQSMLLGVGVQSLLYHGDMSGHERDVVLAKFKDVDSPFKVMIIQMNAGGTGLNLQVANRCYVTSPAYNPSLELQCIARSHRTGQTKEVTCIRLVMRDSVEERILDIQRKKLDMISQALDDLRIVDKLNKHRVHLSKDDICSLFKLSEENAMSRTDVSLSCDLLDGVLDADADADAEEPLPAAPPKKTSRLPRVVSMRLEEVVVTKDESFEDFVNKKSTFAPRPCSYMVDLDAFDDLAS